MVWFPSVEYIEVLIKDQNKSGHLMNRKGLRTTLDKVKWGIPFQDAPTIWERVTILYKEIIEHQINETFRDLSKEDIVKTVIAYEPIWAIGTGKTATPEQAEEVHVFMRDSLSSKYDKETANMVRIQYGGSIKPTNSKDLFEKENIFRVYFVIYHIGSNYWHVCIFAMVCASCYSPLFIIFA